MEWQQTILKYIFNVKFIQMEVIYNLNGLITCKQQHLKHDEKDMIA